MVGGHLPKKIYAFLIMMKYDDLYFASRYNFFTDCVEWYFLPKTEIKVFLKKMDIRGFGWRPSIYNINSALFRYQICITEKCFLHNNDHNIIAQYASAQWS